VHARRKTSYRRRMHKLPRPSSSAAPPAVSVITVDVVTLEKLLHHAAFAARMVGHLDDVAGSALIGRICDHVDTIAPELAELLGAPHGRMALDGAAAADHEAREGAPMLTSIAGGAQ